MIYLDNGATSFPKPPAVRQAVLRAMETCANPGRGGHRLAMNAAREVFRCRETAGRLFGCETEQVVLTGSCTHGLNIAIRSLAKEGSRAVISGFEHNAVTRTLHGVGARVRVAGRRLFDWEDTLEDFRRTLDKGADLAVFTHVSNVFGYILPVEQMARMCRERGVPFIVDAAQSAGTLAVSLKELGADFIAMPGHKGLLGPQGTGLLLCAGGAEPLLRGGTGNLSQSQEMPAGLPERLEPGTLNVPGIAGLRAGMEQVMALGTDAIFQREYLLTQACIRGLRELGLQVFSGPHQGAVVSFLPPGGCEEAGATLAEQGFALRPGLHCAPLAHESAGTLQTGTLRVSPGYATQISGIRAFLRAASKLRERKD